MELYIKDGAINPRKRIVLVAHGVQTINPSHDMLIAAGWEPYEAPELTADELLETAKENKAEEIKAYDASEEVNAFYIGEERIWLDKATRAGLMLRFEAERAMGKNSTSLWNHGAMYTLPLESAFNMLYALEIYASACYDNTQRHLANVEKMATIEEVEQYDYTQAYPDMLEF